MELKLKPFAPPEALSFNFEELKDALVKKTAMYETVVYSEDQIKTAKADKADLNRLRKAINDERIRLEREYMQPFANFKAQIKELTDIIDESVQAVDKQVKAFEEKRKEEKRKQIEACWQEVLQADGVPAAVCFSHVWDEKWLNATVTVAAIKKAMVEKLEKIAADLAVVRSLPAYAFEAEQMYLSTLDLAKAVSEAHRLEKMAKLKAEHEEQEAKLKAEYAATMEAARMKPAPAPADEPAREWIAFQAYLTPDEARALGQYMKNNGIKYKAV